MHWCVFILEEEGREFDSTDSKSKERGDRDELSNL